MKKQAALENAGGEEKDAEVREDENTPLFGPTIGRRRDFASKEARSGPNSESDDSKETGSGAKAKTQKDRMSAFSIGDEFGIGTSKPLETPLAPQPKEKDALMEALNDLDDDVLEDDEGEVVFESGDGDSQSAEITVDVPSVPKQSTAAKETKSDEHTSQDDNVTPVVSSEVSSADQEATTGPGANEITPQNKMLDTPTVENTRVQEQSEKDTDLPSEVAGLGDDFHNLDMGDGAEGLDAAADFEDFEEDAELDDELEDLENFLTKVNPN